MNVLNRVILQTLKKNRVRTIVTIIGIILSTAMFTAVTTIIASLYGYMRESEVYQSGSYHIRAIRASEQTIASVKGDVTTEYAACAYNIGYASVQSTNPDKPYICLFAYDEAFKDNMPMHLTEGRLPENESEIVLAAHALSNGGMSYSIGDVLELDVGQRLYTFEPGMPAETIGQNYAYMKENEVLSDIVHRSFKIVGFIERPDFEPYSAPGYTAMTVSTGAESFSSAECFIRVLNPKKNFESYLEQHPELSENGSEIHTSLLMLEGYSQYDNITNVVTGFATVLFVLIFVGSVSLIYSAFSISVSERTKQFGLLSSVGATRAQIRRSVLFEALSLSAVGIPLGVASGIGGIGATLFMLRDMFSGFIGNTNTKMHVTVTPMGVLIAVVTAFATVLISAWIPSRRAMRITPIEAIRQSRDVKAKGKTGNSSLLFTRLFGAEGVLARKYYARSRKKYRATIISLAMSVILFISASTFSMYLRNSVENVDNRMNYDGAYGRLTREEFERTRSALAEIEPSVTGQFLLPSTNGEEESRFAYLPFDSLTDEYKRYIIAFNSGEDNDVSMLSPHTSPNAAYVYIDDAAFRKLLSENGLSDEDYFTPESNKVLILNHDSAPVYSENTRENYTFDYLKKDVGKINVSKPISAKEGYTFDGVFWTGDGFGKGELHAYYRPETGDCEYDVHGRPINTPHEQLEYDELTIGALLELDLIGPYSSSLMEIVRPFSAYTGSSDEVNFYFTSNDVAGTFAEMTRAMEDAGVTVYQNNLFDVTEDNRMVKNLVTIINVFSYGFIALISLISVANVFNTVTTNVALRRRDYAMLRSMGMTKKGMNRMTNYECLLYGTRSLLIGLPISFGIAYLMHRIEQDAAHTSFILPWTAIAIAVASVFAVVFASMLYSTGKLKKDNPIDALKDENI